MPAFHAVPPTTDYRPLPLIGPPAPLLAVFIFHTDAGKGTGVPCRSTDHGLPIYPLIGPPEPLLAVFIFPTDAGKGAGVP
ncbi:MAG TPA: hypothetical protein DET40_15020 [Lentisphaeria bacterium]|nr:hypothetical protein [Lentisphaeria bacterium]